MIFKNEYGEPLEAEAEILDNAIMINNTGKENAPDFFITGFFRKIDKHSKNEFIISPGGTDIVLITGVPTNCPTLEPFRYKDVLFSSYFQDTVKGVLFQVFKKAPSYIGVSKQSGLLVI